MRTGREDVFTMVEAMSRHCSKVDIYHFGPLKGLGLRHNVRHWGCSCKEPRVSMAGTPRPLYYLLGNRRIKDVVRDVKDVDYSIENTEYNIRRNYEEKHTLQIRSGPDWSSFVSNWMTYYEQEQSTTYRDKIINGIECIKNTPLGLISGPGFEYRKEDGRLIY